MRKEAHGSARGTEARSISKKRWERPKVAHANVREVTRGGINMMTDPLDITMMMS